MASQIRTAIFAIVTLLSTVLIAVVALPSLLIGENAARSVAKWWSRSVLFSLRVICGLRHEVEGREFIPRGGALVAANHQSMWETIALYAMLDRPAVIFKKELLSIPIYGWWAARSGSIPVARKEGVRALRAVTAAAAEKIAAGSQVVVFPEGTRSAPGPLGKLQPGVASIYLAADAACTPAVHDSGQYWTCPGGFTSVKKPGVITLRFQPPIPTGLARKDFMATLRERLSESPALQPAPANAAAADARAHA